MSKLPFVSSDIPKDLRAFVNRVTEALNGVGANKIVTVNDLVGSGIASTGAGGTITPPAGTVGTPSTPKNVTATGAIQNIVVTWDAPLYSGHAYAEIWGSSTDNVGVAVKVGMTPGAVFTDAVGPSVVRYYWVRFVNTLGVVGAFNAVAGTRGETGSDVAYLLQKLTGQITESQLYTSLGNRINLIDGSGAGSVDARIATETTNRTTADSALSSQITTLSATAGANTAAIQTEASTRATQTGQLYAQYTVKVDTNGYVSGFGLASTANNATPYSSFAVRADQFYIASPSGPGVSPATPFIVQTTATTINGVSVPVGVYITDAFIRNGTITNAKIGNAAIDDAKISTVSAGKITAGSIDVGQYLQSTSFISGTQGWKIHGNGTAEFGAASIRGQLTASQIDTRGLTIKDSSGNIIVSSGGVSASYVSGLGSLATQNSVSASNVSGLGSLATASSVNWNTQITNIPGFGNFAFLSTITSANIGTYISSAAIGNAYISDLSATKITSGYIDAARLDAGVINAKVTNIDAAVIGSGTINSARIGDASITTLKLAGNAVTVPMFAEVSGTPYVGINTSPYTALTGYIDTAGFPMFLIYNFLVEDLGGNTLATYLLVNGSQIKGSVTYNPGDGSGTNGGIRGIAYVASPGTGSIPVQLTVQTMGGSSAVTIKEANFFVLGTKR